MKTSIRSLTRRGRAAATNPSGGLSSGTLGRPECRHGSAGDGPGPSSTTFDAPARRSGSRTAGPGRGRRRTGRSGGPPARGVRCGDPGLSGAQVLGTHTRGSSRRGRSRSALRSQPGTASLPGGLRRRARPGGGRGRSGRSRPPDEVSRNTSSQRSLCIRRRSILPSSRTRAGGSRWLEVAAEPPDEPGDRARDDESRRQQTGRAASSTAAWRLGYLSFSSPSNRIADPIGTVQSRPAGAMKPALLRLYPAAPVFGGARGIASAAGSPA